MKAGFQENFRFLVIFILVLALMNFALVGFDINRQNDYSNEVGQMIAKNGCLDHETEVKAAKLGRDSYHNMFWVTPAKAEKKPTYDINHHRRYDAHHKPIDIVYDYTQPQNYGRKIKFVVHTDIPVLPVYLMNLGSANHKNGLSIKHHYTTYVVSQLAQHDINKQQQQF